MEAKSPMANIPPEYQNLPSAHEVIQKYEKDKVAIKCWCYFALVMLLALLFALVSLWCLRVEIIMLQKKAAILETISVEDIMIVANFGKILGIHLKSNMRKMCENTGDQPPLEYLASAMEDYEYVDVDAGDDYRSGEYVDGAPNDNEVYEYVEKIKRKREIGEYETVDEKSGRSEREKLPSEDASTENSPPERGPEFTSRERINYRLSRKHRKHRKSRIGSANKLYTETQSTTSVPILVRRSRTKATQSHETGLKQPWMTNRMGELFEERTSSHRDAITKEEGTPKDHPQDAVSRSTGLQLNGSSDETPDALSYNMITIHFSADTSHYSRERDPHYFGNGRMQIKSEVYKDWKPAHWTQGLGMTQYFQLKQGRVTVFTTGIYLIYAQIQYSNVQEVNGFSVFRNNEIVVQCITTSTHPDKQEIKSNTCGISTTILLQSNDSVCIKDLHHGRYVVLTPEKSYFGLVLLSPFK